MQRVSRWALVVFLFATLVAAMSTLRFPDELLSEGRSIVIQTFVRVIIPRGSQTEMIASTTPPVVIIGTTTIPVELARTSVAQERGLSGRTSLATGTGMFFFFDRPNYYGFWMKEMNFPIDMVWISATGTITHIVANAATSSYPQVFIPRQPSLYVLEVNAGTAKQNGWRVGTAVGLQRIPNGP